MSHPAPLPAPLYQGSVNTWECDEGGHLNVRFHLERAMIGLAHMANALGMPRAFTPAAGATLVPYDVHIRFLKEARPGAPLVMHGGVVQLNDCDAVLCLDMRHADGAPASCFTVKAAHAEARDFRSFPWSARSRAAAKIIACTLPAHAKPRSIDVSRAPSNASRDGAIGLGAVRIGASLVSPDQCDAFGRLRTEHFFGRASDSVPNLLASWRKEAGEAAGAAPAGAVVEARLVIRRWPRAGELIELHSGVAEVAEKTQRLVHWMCDPEAGHCWASLEAVALTFDIATRKAITPSEDVRARIRKRAIGIAV
ncbi:MAG: thioesterase family protein [Hyphomonadaceae bacterium]|nr:thioesterase family protein [Hyphomonadaceae bacterium]